jgi:hypothetical protein
MRRVGVHWKYGAFSMIRGICLSVAALVAFAVPAMAQDACVTPYAPTVPDGATATKEQILSTRDQVMAFLKASDDYQQCLKLYLDQQIAAAAKDRDKKEIDPALKKSIVDKADSNQREKVRTGTELNTAVRTFNAAHPAQ